MLVSSEFSKGSGSLLCRCDRNIRMTSLSKTTQQGPNLMTNWMEPQDAW